MSKIAGDEKIYTEEDFPEICFEDYYWGMWWGLSEEEKQPYFRKLAELRKQKAMG